MELWELLQFVDGSWSPRQADAVCDALAPELDALGLDLRRVDATAFNKPARVFLVPFCRRCNRPINYALRPETSL